MSDAAPVVAPTPELMTPPSEDKSGLGRNQLMILGLTGVSQALAFALVLTGKLAADQWLSFATTSTTAALGFGPGGSALIKAVQAWRR